MSKGLRLSEKWFQRGLWLVALVFASFLIGLGGLIVGDLPKVERTLEPEQFIDPAQLARVRAAISANTAQRKDTQDAIAQAELTLTAAGNANQSARETFANWLATRKATELPEQDRELIARTRALDALKASERNAQQALERLQQGDLTLQREAERNQQTLSKLEDGGRKAYESAVRAQEMRVFLFRLAVTLPLLLIAGWLFVKKRKSAHWPFVWGFVFFALFAFFVELVPYLPNYGGYVRYIVGIVLTGVIGHYLIGAMQRYLAQQKLAEQKPDAQRRQALSYDLAQARMAKQICPGCERPVDLKDTGRNFCMHCGICLFDHCGHCQTRKSAFGHFCHSCGTVAVAERTPG
ncbi:zinc ribbon domain-containing protein [Jeongeupia wiesaeckerbachi]|uniref:serine endopeptidase n=1 Tax=Jeongeupia wiesaeckerbachi TaxID=3051218 RepID=UPI003D8015F9